ncbi:MAG: hypothetical protein IJL54_02500 [Prevotella sp.]|nr:hypothetical protein [Prevotella sp.]
MKEDGRRKKEGCTSSINTSSSPLGDYFHLRTSSFLHQYFFLAIRRLLPPS